MSSRIFQNVIIQMKDAIDRPIGVVDDQGFVVAASELAMIGSRLDDFHAYDLEQASGAVSTENRCFCALTTENAKLDYAAFLEGADAISRTVCAVAAVAFNEAKKVSSKSTTKPRSSRTSFPITFCPATCMSAPRSFTSSPTSPGSCC